jgi:hypothetical protein
VHHSRFLCAAIDSGPYLERGIVNNLWSGNGKSRQREIAALCQGRETLRMKTNEYGGSSEASTLPSVASDAPHVTEADRASRAGNSPSGPVAAAVATRQPFPVRTLIVCFTIWLIATQAMIFDQVKFEARAHLLDQATRSLGGPQVVVPSKPLSDLRTGAKVQRL